MSVKKELTVTQIGEICSKLHPDDWLSVQQLVSAINPLLRMRDTNYQLTKQLESMALLLKNSVADSIFDSEERIMAKVEEAQKTLLSYWEDPKEEESSDNTKTGAVDPNVLDRDLDLDREKTKPIRILVYGLLDAQRQFLTEGLSEIQAEINIRVVERSVRKPSGVFDIIVCSRFVSHSDTDLLKKRNPKCHLLVTQGGITSVIKAVNQIVNASSADTGSGSSVSTCPLQIQ